MGKRDLRSVPPAPESERALGFFPSPGRSVFWAGLGCLSAGLFLLPFTEPYGRDLLSLVSPLLVLFGLGSIGLYLFRSAFPPVS